MMMDQSRVESTRDTYNYKSIASYPHHPEYDKSNTDPEVSIMFNEICINKRNAAKIYIL